MYFWLCASSTIQKHVFYDTTSRFFPHALDSLSFSFRERVYNPEKRAMREKIECWKIRKSNVKNFLRSLSKLKYSETVQLVLDWTSRGDYVHKVAVIGGKLEFDFQFSSLMMPSSANPKYCE
jgi:hypothetical protein